MVEEPRPEEERPPEGETSGEAPLEGEPAAAGGGGPLALFGGRLPVPLVAAFGAVAIVGIILAVVVLGGGSGNGGSQESELAGLATDVPTPVATIDPNRETLSPNVNPNLPNLSAGDRIVIAKIGVDAPLTYKPVVPDPNGGTTYPPNPDGADDVAYYDFSAYPGLGGGPGIGGNSVFAGHVDSGKKPCKNGSVPPPCTAVFWDLKLLQVGDEIEVRVNGGVFRYRVTANESVPAVSDRWNGPIYTATAKESLTLISCIGAFSAGQYDRRLVVTAERVG